MVELLIFIMGLLLGVSITILTGMYFLEYSSLIKTILLSGVGMIGGFLLVLGVIYYLSFFMNEF